MARTRGPSILLVDRRPNRGAQSLLAVRRIADRCRQRAELAQHLSFEARGFVFDPQFTKRLWRQIAKHRARLGIERVERRRCAWWLGAATAVSSRRFPQH